MGLRKSHFSIVWILGSIAEHGIHWLPQQILMTSNICSHNNCELMTNCCAKKLDRPTTRWRHFTHYEFLDAMVMEYLHQSCLHGHTAFARLGLFFIFMPRHKKWRGTMLYPPTFLASVRPSVRLSVRPSAVEHSCPVHNFDTVWDNFTKLGTNINHDQTTCSD